MRALVWNGRKLCFERSHPTPKSDDRTALVHVLLAGICSTDLQIFKGYMGFQGIPGHEFVGEVKEGPTELVGKRVAGEINFACGRCEFCLRGLRRHCPQRKVMGILGADGSFAEYMSVPIQNLHLVPESLSNEEAVFTEPLAAAFEISEQIQFNPTDDVLVLGDGKLGLLCAQALRLTGANVNLLGKHENKVSLLKGMGIHTIMLSDWKSRLFDVVVEATGSSSGLKMALEIVRPRGTLVLKSTLAEPHTLSLAPLVINENTVVGSRCGPFLPALQALAKEQVEVTSLIDGIYSLDDGAKAVAHAAKSGALKVMLRN